MLLALRMVDYVHIFDEPDPIAFLKELKPDVHVNGSEYGEDCIESETVRRGGGDDPHRQPDSRTVDLGPHRRPAVAARRRHIPERKWPCRIEWETSCCRPSAPARLRGTASSFSAIGPASGTSRPACCARAITTSRSRSACSSSSSTRWATCCDRRRSCRRSRRCILERPSRGLPARNRFPLLQRNPYIAEVLELGPEALVHLQTRTFDRVINLDASKISAALATAARSRSEGWIRAGRARVRAADQRGRETLARGRHLRRHQAAGDGHLSGSHGRDSRSRRPGSIATCSSSLRTRSKRAPGRISSRSASTSSGR